MYTSKVFSYYPEYHPPLAVKGADAVKGQTPSFCSSWRLDFVVFLWYILAKGRVFPEEEQAVSLEAGMIHEKRSCAGVGKQKALC